MLNNRISKKTIFLFCLAMIGLTIFPFMGCGGSGGGGGNTNNPTPTPAPAPAPQPPPDINVSKTQIAFGDVVLDSFSDETISIQNTGSSNLIIGQIAQANALSAPFSIISDNCSGMQLAPSQTCTLQVRFSPTSQGGIIDAFDIPSNDPVEKSVTVSVSGYGRGLKVSMDRVYTDACPKVKLHITVTDKNANPLAGLTKDNFSIFENGVLKAIESVSQVASPISEALVLDYSGSMTNTIPDLEAAAKGFIDQLSSINSDEASVTKYSTDVYLMQAFTTDKAALKAAIDAPFPGNTGLTRIYDAVWSTVDDIAARNDRRAIVVISDGQDNASVKTLTEVIDHAKEKGVNVFTIGLGGDVNAGDMQQLAEKTGGQYFFAPTSTQLNEIYLKIAAILAGQYVIEYSSSSSGGGAVILDLEVNSNGLQGKISQTVTVCP